ncbi:MAG: peptidoglycan DD-metalloendopeptidase family protein [Bacteroidales bacterium]|nr:peptidoglycan DD-metalloendopeptidase family protein [Bacteroidales bacterium]
MKKDLLISITFSIFLLPFIDSFIHNPVKNDFINEIKQESKKEYGIEINKFIIDEGRIKPNSSLSSLLGNLNITKINIQEIIEKASEVFDLKKIRTGNKYKVFYSQDSLNDIKYLVYEQSFTDYVLFDFTDSIEIFQKQKKVIIEKKSIVGIIESSLWNSIIESGGNPILAMELSDIYAWTIDFFGLQKQDKFKIFYDEEFVDGKSIGIGKINAAWFEHADNEYYAIPFYQDSTLSFFDLEGNSLKKAFLKAPLKYSRISSGFSNSRLHPILKIYRAHHGVDYSAPIGTPVSSIGDGVVIKANFSGGAGNYVKIKHNSIYTTGYMHLSKYGKGISIGKHVKQGDIIGYVGSTGLSTGAHLDFRVWKNGQNVNPLKLEAPPSEPVKEENKEAFNKMKTEWFNKFNNLKLFDTNNKMLISENLKNGK